MQTVRQFLFILISLFVVTSDGIAGDTSKEIRELYTRFYTAQNARNLEGVRTQLIDSPDFLWVSDGKSIWGTITVLERMRGFQEAEIWRVEPNLGGASVIAVTETTAYLHLRLDLVIGSASAPDRIGFLVSALCVKTTHGWKISALFTTTAKPD